MTPRHKKDVCVTGQPACERCGGLHIGSYECPYLGPVDCHKCGETIPEEVGYNWNIHPGRKFDSLGNVYHVKCEFVADSALPSQPAGERERFEKWQLSLGNSWLTRDESAYRSNVTQWQWEAWQAARSSSPEGEPDVRTFQQADCPKCGKRITVEVLGLAAAPSREWIKRAAKEICDKGYCGTYDFVEEIIARHAATEGK